MSRRVSVAELRANLADVLGAVHYGNEPVVVERKGKPFAVLVNPEEYERLLARANGVQHGQAEQVTEGAPLEGGPPDPLTLAGAWSDLNWEEFADELDRIRHESKPSPIFEFDDQ